MFPPKSGFIYLRIVFLLNVYHTPLFLIGSCILTSLHINTLKMSVVVNMVFYIFFVILETFHHMKYNYKWIGRICHYVINMKFFQSFTNCSDLCL